MSSLASDESTKAAGLLTLKPDRDINVPVWLAENTDKNRYGSALVNDEGRGFRTSAEISIGNLLLEAYRAAPPGRIVFLTINCHKHGPRIYLPKHFAKLGKTRQNSEMQPRAVCW